MSESKTKENKSGLNGQKCSILSFSPGLLSDSLAVQIAQVG